MEAIIEQRIDDHSGRKRIAEGSAYIVDDFVDTKEQASHTKTRLSGKFVYRYLKDTFKNKGRAKRETEIMRRFMKNGVYNAKAKLPVPQVAWSDDISMVLEKINGLSLNEALRTKGISVHRVDIGVVDILHDLRLHRIVHCDMHAKNILVELPMDYAAVKNYEVERCVLTDFDMAHAIPSHDEERLLLLHLSDALCIILSAMRYGAILWQTIAYARDVVDEILAQFDKRSDYDFIQNLSKQVKKVKTLVDKAFIDTTNLVEWLFNDDAIEGLYHIALALIARTEDNKRQKDSTQQKALDVYMRIWDDFMLGVSTAAEFKKQVLALKSQRLSKDSKVATFFNVLFY